MMRYISMMGFEPWDQALVILKEKCEDIFLTPLKEVVKGFGITMNQLCAYLIKGGNKVGQEICNKGESTINKEFIEGLFRKVASI